METEKIAKAKSLSSPWLGERRGRFVDWATQRWVQATGRRIELSEHAWIDGPVGGTRRIGPDYFDELAVQQGLSVGHTHRVNGLMESFGALDGPGFDAATVDPLIHAFYESTSSYTLDVWSEWSGFFRPFGRLLALLFSTRLDQLNVPLSPLSTSRGMSSRVVKLIDPATSTTRYTGWVRQSRASGQTVYVGSYSITTVPGHPAPCVKVVFPLPNGNATVLLRPSVDSSGALVLQSSGQKWGDPGFYFLVRGKGTTAWIRSVRTFREKIRVYVEAGELRTDHLFTLWGRPFLKLHYRMRRDLAEIDLATDPSLGT